MCKKSGEAIDHRLFHYDVANALWVSIFSFFGLDWVMPRRVIVLFACWRCQFGSLHSLVLWKMVLSCIVWCILRERNDRSFEDRERMVVELNVFFFNILYHWVAAYNYFHISNFQDYLALFFFFFFSE